MTEGTKHQWRVASTELQNEVERLRTESGRGSFIDLSSQFETLSGGLARIYRLILSPQVSNEMRPELERIAIDSKLSILKTLYTLHPERSNISFEILSFDDLTTYTADYTEVQKTLKLVARYDPRYHRENRALGEEDFCVYLELGMTPPGDLTGGVTALVKRRGVELEEVAGTLEPIGCDSCLSPLYEFAIPMRDLKSSEIVDVTIQTPKVRQSMPFSIYDVQVSRYRRGIGRLSSEIRFDPSSPVWPEVLCYDNHTTRFRSCSESELDLDFTDRRPDGRTSGVKLIREGPETEITVLFTQYSKPPHEGGPL
jgi:hypothetical protein